MSNVFRDVLRKDAAALKGYLDAGGDPNVESFGEPLLYRAADQGMLECVELLLRHGAKPSATRKPTGKIPLHRAAHGLRADIVELLLDAGSPVDSEDMHGNAPLFYAVMTPESSARSETIKLLLSRGADPNHKNRYGNDVSQWISTDLR